MQLTKEQQAAVDLRNRTVLVSAAAGAGKTRVLVERLMGYVTDPVNPRNIDDFLVVTYTRAAAGELRGRILARLREMSELSPENDHLRAQLTRVYTAKIGTLDAYCREILLENAAEAGLPSGYRAGDAAELELLQSRILEETLDALYERAQNNPDDPFRHAADTYGDERGDAVLSGLILHIWQKTRCHANPMGWLQSVAETFQNGDAVWRNILLDQAYCVTETFFREYTDLEPSVCGGELAGTYGVTLQRDLLGIRQMLDVLRQGEWDEAALFAAGFSLETLKSYRGSEAPPEAGEFKELRDRWKKALTNKIKPFLTGFMESHLSDAAALDPLLRGLIDAVRAFEEALTAEKLRLSVLDFSDVERIALSLLKGSINQSPVHASAEAIGRGDTPLAERLSSRFCEILVDEYQDINPLQDAILDALSRNGENLFYVGDARQSIYRFQMAEPLLFLDKFNRFPLYTEAPPEGPCKVLLTQNFRSQKPVLDAVNHVFSHIECPEMGALQPDAFLRPAKSQTPVPAPAGAIGSDAGVSPEPMPPAVELLIGSDDETSEAERVARRLRELCESGEASPGDCVILLRSPKSRIPEYRKALESEGLSCAAPSGEGYWDRPEIMTTLGVLEAIDNARLDVPLVAALRGPIAGCTPDDLAALRLLEEGPLCDCLPLSEEPKIKAFWDMFQKWRGLAADLPPYALAARVMADSHLPQKLGPAARENLLMLPEVLRGYTGTLRDLPDWCGTQRESGASPAAGSNTSASQSLEAVRILSIHGSKGLEFPVVVAAGLGKRLNLQDQRARLLAHPRLGLGVKRRDEYSEYPTLSYRAVQAVMDGETRSEELRLLYVAMTRAEQRLILSCNTAEGKYGESGMVTRGDLIMESSVAAWLLKARSPAWNLAPSEVLKTRDEMEPDEGIAAQNGSFGVFTETDWQYPHSEAVDTPSKLTATGLKGRFPDAEAREDAADVFEPAPSAAARARPRFMADTASSVSGAERGSATHLFLQFCDFSKCAEPNGIEAEVNRLLSQRLLTPEQAAAADLRAVAGFFATVRGRELLSAKGLRREQKFSLPVGNGDLPGLVLPEGETVLLQGVIDCYYETEDGMVLIDFKTDRVRHGGEAALAERYRPQMDAYTYALTAMTGQPVVGRFLFFLSTLCEVSI